MTHRMSLTPELVALCFRKEEERGFGEQWTPLTETDLEDMATDLIGQCGQDPLWVFAYGSLIWKPTFDPIETRRATAVGWHRSFCMELTAWRGTPEQPGLMMALDRGGRCNGVVFRLSDDVRKDEIKKMLRREIVFREEVDMVRFIKVQAEQGELRAIVFWAGPKDGDGIALKLPLERVAWVLARACGYGGSCAEYLYNTVSHLEALGIRDRNLWRLQKLVAQEIERIYFPAITAA
jgi:cation transport protein ChaC